MKTSKMLIMSYMGDHVWLMTSRQTEPELSVSAWVRTAYSRADCCNAQLVDVRVKYPVYEADARALVRVLIG